MPLLLLQRWRLLLKLRQVRLLLQRAGGHRRTLNTKDARGKAASSGKALPLH